MNKKLQAVIFALIIISISFFCKTTSTYKGIEQSLNNSCCIDTFRLKYQVALSANKVKKIDENIYVGILKDTCLIESIPYMKLVFGESISSVIALVRLEEETLSYRGLSDKDTTGEKVLLYFDKKVNEKWKVHIDDSYFWRKEITYSGIEQLDNDKVFVYTLETDEGYTSLGNQLSKIYFCKDKGFLKLVIKTHWISVEIKKSK
jgi:hypothetical protein